MTETKYGNITSIEIGYGGYQDCCIGLKVKLEGKDWSVCDFKGTWAPSWVDSGGKDGQKSRDRNHLMILSDILICC